jgi:2-methylcitrate dehydratase PrpD
VGRRVDDAVTASSDYTTELARLAAAVDVQTIDRADLERVRHCVLDWLGATVAGASSAVARAVHASVSTNGDGAATVVGTSLRCTPRDAALANGVAAHALELDDVSRSMRGHPSASVCAATLALAEERGAPGEDVAAALYAGYDVAAGIAVVLGPGHSAAGWHATGTVGTFASAAACSRLLRFDAETTLRALALAATQAAGLKASVGTAGKALHAGKAAADGMLAALLAEQGAGGAARAVDAFAAATTSTFDATRRPVEPGVRSIVFKRHACCGLAHASIDALLDLRSEHEFTPGDVRSVTLEVGAGVLDVCRYPEPRDELEAMFSLPFSSAVALAGRDTGPSGFTRESLRDPLLLELSARVTTTLHDGDAAHATIELADGRRLEARRAPAGPASDDDLPDQWHVLTTKFLQLAEPVLGAARARDVVEQLRSPALAGLLAAAREAHSA